MTLRIENEQGRPRAGPASEFPSLLPQWLLGNDLHPVGIPAARTHGLVLLRGIHGTLANVAVGLTIETSARGVHRAGPTSEKDDHGTYKRARTDMDPMGLRGERARIDDVSGDLVTQELVVGRGVAFSDGVDRGFRPLGRA